VIRSDRRRDVDRGGHDQHHLAHGLGESRRGQGLLAGEQVGGHLGDVVEVDGGDLRVRVREAERPVRSCGTKSRIAFVAS
jgi:hypothetical protein